MGRSACVRCPRRCAGRSPSVRRRAPLRHPGPARAGRRWPKQRQLRGRQPERGFDQRGRDRMPSVKGSAEISPAAGSLPSVPSCATGASWAPAGAATARSRGSKGRAPGARTRMTANHAASQGCSLSPRCARASTGTPVVSRRDRTPPDRGAVGSSSMVLARGSVKWQQPRRCHGLRAGQRGAGAAPPVQGCSGAICPGGGFGYTRRLRYLEVRS